MLYTLLIVVQFSMTVRLSVFEFPLNSGFAIISHDFPFVNTFFQSFLQIFFGLVQSLCHAFLCRLFFAATPLYYHIISSLSTPFSKVFWRNLRFYRTVHFILTFAVEIKQIDQYSVDAKRKKQSTLKMLCFPATQT